MFGLLAQVPAAPKVAPASQVMALYDYTAQNSDELTFKRGAVITVADKSDPDWWSGTLGSTTGLFPSNYVQETNANQCEWSGLMHAVCCRCICMLLFSTLFFS